MSYLSTDFLLNEIFTETIKLNRVFVRFWKNYNYLISFQKYDCQLSYNYVNNKYLVLGNTHFLISVTLYCPRHEKFAFSFLLCIVNVKNQDLLPYLNMFSWNIKYAISDNILNHIQRSYFKCTFNEIIFFNNSSCHILSNCLQLSEAFNLLMITNSLNVKC